MPTMAAPLTLEKLMIPQQAKLPDLVWVTGKIHQILLQDKERFYIVTIDDGKKTTMLRFGDPYTGQNEKLSAENPMYSLIEKAFFENLAVEVGYRDFGFDPQAGIERIIIDRVSVLH